MVLTFSLLKVWHWKKSVAIQRWSRGYISRTLAEKNVDFDSSFPASVLFPEIEPAFIVSFFWFSSQGHHPARMIQ